MISKALYLNSPDGGPDRSDEAANRLHRAVFELTRWLRASRPAGALGLSKLGVLAYLQRHGAATATALAAYLRVQPQSMTRLLADLEERGLIARQPDSEDRRQSRIDITPDGAALLQDDVREQRMKLGEAMRASLTSAEQDMLGVAADLIGQLARSAGVAGDSTDA